MIIVKYFLKKLLSFFKFTLNSNSKDETENTFLPLKVYYKVFELINEKEEPYTVEGNLYIELKNPQITYDKERNPSINQNMYTYTIFMLSILSEFRYLEYYFFVC